MLVETIKHAKRIKEKILFYIAAPSRANTVKEDLVLASGTESNTASSLGGSKKSKTDTPRAVIQSLNFLALAPKPTYEDGEYRDNLASYFFDDDRGNPLKIGVPYIALEHEDFRRHGNIRSSYPMLQGNPIELANYLWKETREFYRNGPLSNSDGTKESSLASGLQNDGSESSPENSLEDQEGKFNSKIYPMSAINIPIPFLEGSQDVKNCINLPKEKETAEMVKILTKEPKSQITIFISGQSQEVDKYFSNVQKELTKSSTPVGINVTKIADIEITNGYLCSEKKPSQKDLDNFKILSTLEGLQGALGEIKNFLLENKERYLDCLVTRKLLEKEIKSEANSKASPTSELPSLPIEQELDEVKKFISKYEDNWSKIKKASQNNAVWYLGDSPNSSPRLSLVNQEEQLDKKILEFLKYELYKESERENKSLTSKKKSKAKEEVVPTISFTKQELEKEIGGIAQSWFKLQEEVLESTRKCTEGMQRDPWSLKVLHVCNRSGLRRPLKWESPIAIKANNWGSKEFDKLDRELSKYEVCETHLASSEFTGKWDKEGLPICKLSYPKAREKRIVNPKHFNPLPTDLATPSASDFLKSNQESFAIKLDTRLSPRPELLTELLLENDNKQIELYNPVAGRPTGFKEATLWRPILTRKGIPYVENSLSEFGYKLSADPAVFNFAERKVKQAEKCLSPNYPLTPYESLAYFDNGARTAEATVIHPETGEVLWLEGKSYHITPSWRRQTMMVDHSVEEEDQESQRTPSTTSSATRANEIASEMDSNTKELEKAKENALAEDIVTLGQTDSARRIANSARIQTLTERRINYGFATFIVEAEGNKTYEIKETVSTETISMEKERIAIEIDHLIARKEEIETKKNRTKVENNELKKLEDQIEEKTKELDSWAPMLEDFLTAFPPEAPALTTEVYEEKIRSVMKRIYGRFAPFVKNEQSKTETSLKDYQLKWAAIGAVKRGHANSSSPGSGKAQPLDSKVLTTRGWINMGDITLEDQVLTPDGKKADVLGIYPQGKIPVFKITLQDGRTVEACGDHLWKVYEKGWCASDKKQDFPINKKELGFRVVNTNSLKEYLKTDSRYYLPLLDEVSFEEKQLEVDPYILGALIGDGGITHSVGFTNADEDVVKTIQNKLLPDYEIKRSGEGYSYYISHKNGTCAQKAGEKRLPENPYRKALKKLGLYGKSSYEKFIPTEYKYGSTQQRLELIQGLMDTDGSVCKNGSLQYYTTSETLAKDFAEVIYSLGGSAHISPKQTYYTYNGERKKERACFVVHFRHNEPNLFVKCERKKIRISQDYQYSGSVRNKIVSIEAIGSKECQCIYIDHPEHLYLTNNYVITHNTIMSIMSSWEMGHHYNWVICPTIAMKTWAKELERVGLYHEIVGFKKDKSGEWVQRPGVYEHMRELTQRFHNRERKKNRLGKIEPEYYILSAENVCLGGEGNKTYSPWHCDYWVTTKQDKLLKELDSGNLKLPSHWAMQRNDRGVMIRVWSDRSDNSKEIAKYGFKSFLRPVKFHRAVKDCPQCGANAPIWTKHGVCNKCGHSHHAITKVKSSWDMSKHSPKLKGNLMNLSTRPLSGSVWEGDKVSNKQYPLYKMMGKHVGCKIIDEVHNWSNFHSQHGAALLQVKCKDTIVLSGTLCKTHISELEPSLCQIYEANSGEFPYSPWGMDLFKEQFQTLEIESSYRTTSNIYDDLRQVRRSTREKVVPEASNLTKLRALLHGVICSVGETEMERVWDIKPINESIRYVELQRDNAAIYEDWERLMKDAYADCKTEHEKIGMLRKARSQLTNLAYACDGPEKLEATIQWIQEGMESNQRSVIVGPSTRFYTMLCKALKERKIPFMSMGNMAPEKRFDYLNKFRDSDCPNFVSRIRLVNVNFNQLTCCTRILFTGIDPSPAAIRQMQKRLNRIGQDKPVHCTFLISQLPPRVRTSPSSPIGAVTDVEASIGALSGENELPEEVITESYRPLSYEERLFALVLRRENAIKQTLQQADRQRDPQELYEMLKDRQTLNQLLQDIVEDAKNDTDISSLIKGMEENPYEAQTNKGEAHNNGKNSRNLLNTYGVDEISTKVPYFENFQESLNLLDTPIKRNGEINKSIKLNTSNHRYSVLNSEEILEGLPKLPEGFEFIWKTNENSPNILQGELFK